MTTGEPSNIFFYLFIKLSLHRPRWIKLKRFFYFQIKEPPGMHIEWTEWFGTESAENIRYVEWRASSSGLCAGRAHFCVLVLWNRKRHSSELNRSRRIRRKFHESAPVSVLKTLAIVLFYCLSFILLISCSFSSPTSFNYKAGLVDFLPEFNLILCTYCRTF